MWKSCAVKLAGAAVVVEVVEVLEEIDTTGAAVRLEMAGVTITVGRQAMAPVGSHRLLEDQVLEWACPLRRPDSLIIRGLQAGIVRITTIKNMCQLK